MYISDLHSSEWVKLILSSKLGLALKKITFSHCYQLQLSYLAFCTQLESLTITQSEKIVIADRPGVWNSFTFLPRLKEFESAVCLGWWSSLLESKPTLTSLKLNCCHTGLVVIFTFYYILKPIFNV